MTDSASLQETVPPSGAVPTKQTGVVRTGVSSLVGIALLPWAVAQEWSWNLFIFEPIALALGMVQTGIALWALLAMKPARPDLARLVTHLKVLACLAPLMTGCAMVYAWTHTHGGC
ncbi:hypothetical protein JGU66_23935 [Myxococcaceae bacterium JPH2]|nr:hypothetical protein [Myxococcaceae bacterium JPH2]